MKVILVAFDRFNGNGPVVLVLPDFSFRFMVYGMMKKAK
jgi:hypothetical protein